MFVIVHDKKNSAGIIHKTGILNQSRYMFKSALSDGSKLRKPIGLIFVEKKIIFFAN